MFYGSDTHAESAAAIFSLIASCRLHAIDPEQYLDEILRVLPYWPSTRHLELARQFWLATREATVESTARSAVELPIRVRTKKDGGLAPYGRPAITTRVEGASCPQVRI